MQKLRLQFIVAMFEIGYEPIDNILKRYVLDQTFSRFSAQFSLAARTLVSTGVFSEKRVNTAFAEGAHAFVDSVRISVHPLAQPASQIL